jgi:hypothetical protein
MPEIDEGALAQLRNVDAFVRRGLSNPNTRRKILEVQKTLNPETAIPELDESDPIRKDLETLRAEMEADRRERAERDAAREEEARLAQLSGRWTAGQAVARKKGYADEGLAKLEKFMEEQGILNHEAAIPYYEQLNPPPLPVTPQGSRWDFFGPQPSDSPDLKLLYEGHDEAWLNTVIPDTLNRVRNGGMA